ncbi:MULTISPECIES: site-specific DNA-methyltransferase [unclassified Bacillus cereus group]|uniref:site-specific DNA-methyltransferase n=1 Tax=unclassified Bacillus cereus group TaxID=2750818 RepID=UPI001C4D1BA3|nr:MULTISPECIES: site-specific DNA-methyltransferase [unclassified Bacillus cereus group]MDA2662448.1 site-specific DNA-methyltransferase [Bacillus cereus group sp. Bc032]MDA2673173.1 site-specific DNA-methyltransferase [Bacillus cereus group sp. Bc031]MDA2678601.1 site-specific DNA-methyltransferase [Bacillus cereus group sp. Bc029]MDA2684110.1 site-specific DNA-methyltransferase [Bacillus cereus group sp. Bc030]MDA2739584.1 site-specific DNA-methyltransferase [Bacillus cereus group sp. Bc011
MKLEQMTLFENKQEQKQEQKRKGKKSNKTTFTNNMSLPIHRWFRYSAGFSAEWAESIIQKYNHTNREDFQVFDPFAGSGTVLIASDKSNVIGAGVDSHPFVSRMTKAKLLWETDTLDLRNYTAKILAKAEFLKNDKLDSYPDLIYKCYPEEILLQLQAIKKALMLEEDKESNLYQLSWLALVPILRACSTAGTAQWQYIQPSKKTKAKIPFETYKNQISIMIDDMLLYQNEVGESRALFYKEDARNCPSIEENWADLIITSPPYANNYDYADATRLEMSFFNEISGWGDLQEKVRPNLIRACTQHVSKLKNETFDILQDSLLEPIYNEIYGTCKELELERENHGGKKNYHTMIATYFLDMAKVWLELRRICKEGSTVCFVIGDSAPYGVYVPVDEWLGKLAISAGFKEFYFEKERDRNTKWKNRKHDVPLKEGFLWVRG